MIAAPGTAAMVSMAFARIARCPLSASDDLNPIMLPSAEEAYWATAHGRLRKLSEPGRHDRQSEWSACRLAGSKESQVKFVP